MISMQIESPKKKEVRHLKIPTLEHTTSPKQGINQKYKPTSKEREREIKPEGFR